MNFGIEKLGTVFRDATDPIVIEDLEGIVVDLNDQAVRTYGFSRDELIGRPIKTLVPKDRHQQADELLRRCRDGQIVRDVEGLRVHKDGEIIPVLLSLSLLKDDDGQPIGIATFAKDISNLRAAEEEVRQLTRVFREAADPILLEDLDGIVTDLNQAAERLYGWSRDELIGRPIKAIVPESRHWQADELLERCKAGEEVRNIEGMRVTKEGAKLPVLITLSVLSNDSGKPIGIASFAKEITAQKQAESELRKLAEQLEARVQQRTAEIEEANQRLTHELAVAQELSKAASREHEALLLGDSISVRSLRESIQSYAEDSDPLLLTGPSGAGHEAVARAIHHASPRANRPFIYVDVGTARTAEDSLFETRVDGSGERLPGKAALAAGGTLFLRGVDRLGTGAQASLVQFLRDATTMREAGNQPDPDVRVIANTSADLVEEVRQGRFDSELERLLGRNRFAISSLAERREDIIPIAERIIQLRAGSVGKVIEGLTDDAKESLLAYSWPGNVEELQSVLERAVVLAHSTRLEIPEELLREGPKLGSYTLVRQLGSGAMGEVWLARHALLARPAAVKLIRKQALEAEPRQQETLKARFQREARATASLRSPHTVELYDFGVSEDGSFYYVMEHLTGVDLQTLVEQHGPLHPGRVIHLLSQACLSLGEAHDVGLVHRDIKPSNLFTCTLGGERDFLKVLDFGVVRVTEGADHLVTATGQLTGTPSSMAPEIVAGTQAGAAADIYGLGCVAYWLLTGRNVFEAPNVMALLMQHATKAPDRPTTHNPSVPAELDDLVMQCLKKDPSDRMESVSDLRHSLNAILLDSVWDEDVANAWWNENLPDTLADQSRGHSTTVEETIVKPIDEEIETVSERQ